jgi:hypothetical protein
MPHCHLLPLVYRRVSCDIPYLRPVLISLDLIHGFRVKFPLQARASETRGFLAMVFKRVQDFGNDDFVHIFAPQNINMFVFWDLSTREISLTMTMGANLDEACGCHGMN